MTSRDEAIRALEKAVELVAKATKGPWAFMNEKFDDCLLAFGTDSLDYDAPPPWYSCWTSINPDDGRAIIAAVNFIREHGAAILSARHEVAPVAWQRWLGELRDRMEHCVSAADEGVDYAVPRAYLDAITTLGLMKKVGRGKWAPTEEGEAFAARKPTLPVEIYGKLYEVPIQVQLHIVNLRDKLACRAHTSEARDAARLDWLEANGCDHLWRKPENDPAERWYDSRTSMEAGSDRFQSLRDAVDAAMRQESGSRE